MWSRYDPEGAKGAAGVLNAEMKADLRAQHFKLGYHPGAYESMEQERCVECVYHDEWCDLTVCALFVLPQYQPKEKRKNGIFSTSERSR